MVIRLQKLSGIVVPMVTPFTKNLEIDLEGVKWLTKYLINGGVDALFPNSTTGEFPHLTMDEAIKLVKAVIESSKSSVKIAPGVSANTTLHSIELAKKFRDLGADFVIATTPYYFKYNRDSLRKHFSMLAESVDIGIVLYCIPSTTGILIPPDLVKELALEFSNVVGIKITHDSLTYVRSMIEEVKSLRKDFSVLIGIDLLLLHGLIEGCDGGVLGLANVAPWIHVELVRSWLKGDLAKAIEMHRALSKLFNVYKVGKQAPSVVKACLELLGAPISRAVRPPMEPVADEELETIKAILDELRIPEEAKKYFPS